MTNQGLDGQQAKAVSTEEQRDLQNQIEMGQHLEVMVTTPGWNQILAPWLSSMKKGFEKGIRSAKKLEDFLSAQQNINLIEAIFNYVKTGIVLGKGASQKLDGTAQEKIEELGR